MVDVNPVILSVSQLNKYVKSIIDSDYNLNCIFLTGEISNFTNHIRTGHLYFTLKDESCAVKAVMFKGNAVRLKFLPADGMNVIVRGRVSVFEASGQYQLYVDDMQPDGVGALAMQYEQLKEKLSNEGLFSIEHKRPIPKFPQRVGVITSPTGAAVQDIIKILNRRCKGVEIVFYPAQVQGEDAVEQLIQGVKELNRLGAADVIIIGRGGGSIEDLWAFNSEALARAVYESEIPVISAVGHETDFTIIDFVSDLRAATPSAAAELAVADDNEQLIYIENLKSAIKNSLISKIKLERETLAALSQKACFKKPEQLIEYQRLLLDKYTYSLYNSLENSFTQRKAEYSRLVSKLDALSPLKTLSRGYCVTYKNEKAVNSIENLSENDIVTIRYEDGCAICEVKEKKCLN